MRLIQSLLRFNRAFLFCEIELTPLADGNTSGLRVIVVTFSCQVKLIREVMMISFPTAGEVGHVKRSRALPPLVILSLARFDQSRGVLRSLCGETTGLGTILGLGQVRGSRAI